MNYNKVGTFSNRPQSAGLGSKGSHIKKPPPKNNFSKPKNPETDAKLVQPEWNSSLVENPHKLSKAEIL